MKENHNLNKNMDWTITYTLWASYFKRCAFFSFSFISIWRLNVSGMESYSFNVISTFKESDFVTFNRPNLEVRTSISKFILQSSGPFSFFPLWGKGKDLHVTFRFVYPLFFLLPRKNKEYVFAGYCNPTTVHIALINPVSSMHGVSFPSLLCAQSF